MRTYDAIVVGAGAAGMLCAGIAAQRGLSVLLLDKNQRPGRKLLITGKGRCNVTNDCDIETFMAAVRSNNRFLYSAAHAFSPTDTMDFFKDRGVKLKTERGGRVFPASDKAADIVDALVEFVERGSVWYEARAVRHILCQDGVVRGVKLDGGEEIFARSVVLATGGASYPLTGSTGDGYAMAEELGHTVVPIRPSLIPVIAKEKWCGELMGLSLRNVTLKVEDQKGKTVFEELGEMLFTHFGVSGPLVLSASSHMKGEVSQYKMFIDLKPGLTESQLDARLLRDFAEMPNKNFSNALDKLLPQKLIPVMVRLSGIDPEEKVHQVTKEQRHGLLGLLKCLPITPKGYRPIDEAIVTAGGVNTKEVSPKTMESKLVPGLYFAGEILDLDAYTGGYNLQIAFSTGHLAGQNLPGQ